MGTNADIVIESGNFTDRHKPVHLVTITKPFLYWKILNNPIRMVKYNGK